MVTLPDEPTWRAALELADRFPEHWTLIGARMVELHGLERGATPPRRSVDLDVLAPVRLIPDSTETFSRQLLEAGFEFDGASASGIGHRFRREGVSVDVLAPDGLGEHTSLRTVAGARTLEVPGGSQALRRTELLSVRAGKRQGALPRPNLLGAILVKARAIRVDDVPEAQRRDLAFLLTLVEDPFEMQEALKASERRWLRDCQELLDPSHSAWRGLEGADDGRLAFSLLAAVNG